MKERCGRRRSDLGLAFGSALLVLASIACTETKKEAPAAPAASALVATASSAQPAQSAQPALAADAAPPAEAEAEAVVDGGTDAGPRKLRRLVAKTDAGVLVETVAAAPPPEPPAADPRKGKKVAGAPMSDEAPYGGGPAAGSGAPVLKKTPLPSDDPWAKAPSPAPTPAH